MHPDRAENPVWMSAVLPEDTTLQCSLSGSLEEAGVLIYNEN